VSLSPIALVRKCGKGLVHPTARLSKLERARHETFILARVAAAALVALLVPRYLALAGAPEAMRIAALLWPLAPLAAILYLMRTGKLFEAELVSLGGLAALAAIVTVGARLSPEASLGWLMLLPFEAAVFGSSVVLRFASLLALAMLLALAGLESGGLVGATGGLSAAYAALHLASRSRMGHARRRVEASHARHFQVLSDAIGDLVLRHDAAGGVISATGDVKAMFGLDAEALLGRGLFNRVHVADRPAYLHAVDMAAQRDGTTSVTVRLRTGETLNSAAGYEEPVFAWAEIRVRRFSPDAEGGWAGDGAAAISVARNVTDAKTAEQRLEAARAEAELANSWKDRLLANVSHELRTPLNAILGFSEMLGDPELTPREAHKRAEYARIIHGSAEHLLALVNVILDTSKIAAGQFRIAPESFDVGRMIADCCDMVRLRAEAGGVELARAPMDGLSELVADKRACRQILINLLSNAVKFTPRGGRVVVGADVAGDRMQVHVMDTGVGIPPEFLPRLGDPFFQVRADYDRDFEGAGLGLSLVRGLVGLHGGLVRLESVVGVGTRVTACLPLVCHAPDEPGQGAAAPLETASHFGPRAASRAISMMQEKKIA